MPGRKGETKAFTIQLRVELQRLGPVTAKTLAAQNTEFWTASSFDPSLIRLKSACTQIGGFARYRPTAVTTLRDQPPNAWRTSASPVLGPDGGEASNQRLAQHEEPAEIEPPLSKIITS